MKKRVLLFGDSNTWGYNGKDGSRFADDIRWSGLLAQKLGSGYTVIEEAQNGRATVWDDPVENRMAGLKYLWPCMESQSPFDLIAIMLGTNDTKPYFGMTAVNIARGAARLCDIAMRSPFGRNESAPAVLLVAPVLIGKRSDDGVFGEQAAEKSKQFAREYEIKAKELGCYFMDAAQFASPGADDHLHIGPEGQQPLADAFYNKIKEILG